MARGPRDTRPRSTRPPSSASAICSATTRCVSAAKRRASHAVAASRSTATRAASPAAALRWASFSARCDRRRRFSSRGNSCISPTFCIVMKSRVSDHASAPDVGTFSRPSFSFGSGSSPAGPAISRAASAIACCALSCGARATASRTASAKESGSEASAGPATRSVVLSASAARRNRRRSPVRATGKTEKSDMKPPRMR